MREFMNISESPSDIKISHYTNKILVKEMLFELIFTRKETKTRFKIFSSKKHIFEVENITYYVWPPYTSYTTNI